MLAGMNKAFTRERDDEDDEEAVVPAPVAGGKNYITPQGYVRLRAELMQLMDEERPQVVEVRSGLLSKALRGFLPRWLVIDRHFHPVFRECQHFSAFARWPRQSPYQ